MEGLKNGRSGLWHFWFVMKPPKELGEKSKNPLHLDEAEMKRTVEAVVVEVEAEVEAGKIRFIFMKRTLKRTMKRNF